MLDLAIVFFIIGVLAAVFDFGEVSASAAGIATMLFIAFVVRTVALAIVRLVRRRETPETVKSLADLNTPAQ